ncbi:MAG: thioredoxin [Anaerolineaceae bacterium]|nr:thioredoxin [Anaerolineaceae bacterium]
MTALTPLGKNEFEAKVLLAEKPVLVEFGAPWCGPCRLLEPVLEELAADYSNRVDFYTVDVDQSPELAMQHSVMGVPTVMLFKDGKLMERMTGFRPRKAVEKLFLSKL